MELDDLKRSWGSTAAQLKTGDDLRLMLRENRHPVLKRIRKQIIIETTGWVALLLCYYTMFDGETKPIIANAMLITGVLAALLHNLTGYNFSRNLVVNGDINTALHIWLKKMKVHAILTIILRVTFIAGLLVFFCWNVNIDSRRYVLLGAGLALMIVQLIILSTIWAARIRSMRDSLDSLSS